METILYQVTTVLLVVGWVTAELYVRRKARRGTVVEALHSEDDLADLLQSNFLVRTDDGRLVVARANGCVRCQGDLRPGRRVGLLSDRGVLTVALTAGVARCDETSAGCA